MFIVDLGRGEMRAGLMPLGHACFVVSRGLLEGDVWKQV